MTDIQKDQVCNVTYKYKPKFHSLILQLHHRELNHLPYEIFTLQI